MNIIDLSIPIEEGMQTFPRHWHPMVEISQLGRFGIENRETRKLVLGTHTGTHVDAPNHFIPGGLSIDRVSLSQLNGNASLVDLTLFSGKNEISKEILSNACVGLNIERLLLRFDGDRLLGTSDYYTDQPWLSSEAAQWLVDNGCRLLGLDIPMPDNPNHGWGDDQDSPIHKILLGNGVILVEYLTNLSLIPKGEFIIIVAPLKIVGADGSPARCFAIVEKEEWNV
jgi:arylformamidase